MHPQEVAGQSEPSLLDESYATSYREDNENEIRPNISINVGSKMNQGTVYDQKETNTKSGVTNFARSGDTPNHSFGEMTGRLE